VAAAATVGCGLPLRVIAHLPHAAADRGFGASPVDVGKVVLRSTSSALSELTYALTVCVTCTARAHGTLTSRHIHRPTTMSLSQLATVELQLLLHFCDAPSALRLARCSRATLAAALQPFAWSHAEPLQLQLSADPSPPQAAQRLASPRSLLRFVPLAVRWRVGGADAEEIEQHIQALGAGGGGVVGGVPRLGPRLRSLRVDSGYDRRGQNAELDPTETALLARTLLHACGSERLEPSDASVRSGQASGLQSLSLTFVHAGDEGALELAKLLAGCSTLRRLELSCARVRSARTRALVSARATRALVEAAAQSGLPALSLSHNALDCGVLLIALPRCIGLTELRLTGCGLRGDDIVELASWVLPELSALTTLDLALNAFERVGAGALATALTGDGAAGGTGIGCCPALRSLLLHSCDLDGTHDVFVLVLLSALLLRCVALRELDLFSNSLGNAGAETILAAWAELHSASSSGGASCAGDDLASAAKGLQSLDLRECFFSQEQRQRLADAQVRLCPRLQLLL